MKERTLVFLKPSAVIRGLMGEIISRIERKGLKITAMKLLKLSREKAEELYEMHKEKAFFQELVSHVTSGPVLAMVIEGPNAIAVMRNLIGKTNPLEASPGTIRGDYALNVTKNVIHASDSPENAEREIKIFFKEEELKFGESSVKVDRFFSTCPQYASVTRELSRQKGEKFMVEAHYAAKKGVENVANFLGGCGAGRLYCAIEPNGDIKPCVFFPTNKETVLGNILKDDFEEIWDNHPLLWKLRIRENLKTYEVNGKIVGCGACPDKYICGGCRARAYSYFNGDVTAADIGCIKNEELWKEIMKKLS